MRVAIEATALLDRPTGVGVFVRELTEGLGQRALAGTDLDVRLFAVSWRGRHRLVDLAPPGTHARSAPVPARPARLLWRVCDLPTVRWSAGRVDLVHGPNFVAPPGAAVFHRRGPRELLTIHDLTVVRFPELCKADTLAYPPLIRRALRRGAHVHAVSQAVADEVCEVFGVATERVTVIPNGVRAVPLAVPAAPGADPARLAGDGRYVLALGTVEPRKDLPSLVRAFDALAGSHPDLRLVIAGADGWGADALATAIARSPHRSRIARIGWVTDAERAVLLRDAAALAYPSVYEGFGIPPLEAMAAGTPVVTTDAGALPSTVGDAALLVPVGDADALAGALARVLDDAGLAAELVARGRARAADFSWDRSIDAMVALYRRLTGAAG